MAAVASLLAMDRTTLTRNLRPREREGLIRLGAEGWHRSRNLEITKDGRSRLREALPLWNKAQQALKKKLGDRTWADVRASLYHLILTA